MNNFSHTTMFLNTIMHLHTTMHLRTMHLHTTTMLLHTTGTMSIRHTQATMPIHTAGQSGLALTHQFINISKYYYQAPVPVLVDTNTSTGAVGRSLNAYTITYMNQLEPSEKIVPLASTRAMPGSMPTSTQELARYGEPRQRTH